MATNPPTPPTYPPPQPNAKRKVVRSKNRQAIARHKARTLRLLKTGNPVVAANLPPPKVVGKTTPQPASARVKQPIKLNPNAKLLLAYTQQQWFVGVARYYTTTANAIGYLQSIQQINGVGVAVCYIPKSKTNPTPLTVNASLTNNGMQQFWVLPVNNLALAIQAISKPRKVKQPKQPKQAKAQNTTQPASNKPKQQPSKTAITYASIPKRKVKQPTLPQAYLATHPTPPPIKVKQHVPTKAKK